MKITKQARRNAKALFQVCQVNGLLDEGRVRSVLDELVQGKPRGYFAILAHLERLVKLDFDRRTARVESALALTHEQEGTLKDQLKARYGEGLLYQFDTDPKLIGGMRVRVGSDVYDGTVQGRLLELEQNFKAA